MSIAIVNTFDSSQRSDSAEIRLYYETHGDPADPALLLVNGYSSQILGWYPGFREQLAERERFVVSFDNRDVGLSTHLGRDRGGPRRSEQGRHQGCGRWRAHAAGAVHAVRLRR